MSVDVVGPDNREYQFPDGTDKAAAVAYFKKKGIGAAPASAAPAAPSTSSAANKFDAYAASDQPKSTPREPVTRGTDFTQRIGQRVQQNIASIPQAVSDVLKQSKGQPTVGPMVDKFLHGKSGQQQFGIADTATAGARTAFDQLHGFYQSWKKDPANFAGDVLTAYIGAGAEIPKSLREFLSKKPEPGKPAPAADALPPELQKKYTEALDKANAAHAEAMERYNKAVKSQSEDLVEARRKLADARKEWVDKAFASKQSAATAEKVANRRQVLDVAKQEYTRLADESIKSAHKSVRGSLDQRWQDMRNRVGADTPVHVESIADAIDRGQAMLQGVPEDLKIFKDIMGQITEERELVPGEKKSAATELKEDIGFDAARTHYSALGDKVYSTEGNLRRALKEVYNAYDTELTKTASGTGNGGMYARLKADWSQYMQDWHDMSSVATGGSPLARALRAADLGYVEQQALSKAGQRMIQQLARYREFGGDPVMVAKIRQLAGEAKSLPKVKPSAMPKPLNASESQPKEAPKRPELKEVPRPKVPAEEPLRHKVGRATARIAGKMLGAKAGSVVGHPLMGYGIGGEAAESLFDKFIENTPK